MTVKLVSYTLQQSNCSSVYLYVQTGIHLLRLRLWDVFSICDKCLRL